MPQMNKGGKFIFGKSVIQPDGAVQIPAQAIQEYQITTEGRVYLFTGSKKIQRQILKSCSFGGGCINDTIIHLATSRMGFGGVGTSGMGSYHGRDSFELFSHRRSIVKKYTWIDLPIRYQPYCEWKQALLKLFLK